MPDIHIIIVAGGSGKRFGSYLPKQFAEVNGVPVIVHTINVLRKFFDKFNLHLVINTEWTSLWNEIAEKYNLTDFNPVVSGEERFFSVKNALDSITVFDDDAIVLIHDAVRPLVSEETIKRVTEGTIANGCAVPVVQVDQSLRKKDLNGSFIPADRKGFVLVQTPQGFNLKRLKEAYLQKYNPLFTDDATVYESAGNTLYYVEGNKSNIKITYPEDLRFAACLLK